MAAPTNAAAVALMDPMEVEKQLESAMIKASVRSLRKLAPKKEELDSGRKLFQDVVVSYDSCNFTDTFMIVSIEKLEQEINAVASSNAWNPEITKQVKALAQPRYINHDDIQVKFCPGSASGLSMHVVATRSDQVGNRYIKVVFLSNSFQLAPKVDRIILEDKEPIFEERTSGFIPGFRKKESVKVSEKTTQRVDERVVPQSVAAGNIEKIRNYLTFKTSKAVCCMYQDGSTIPDDVKTMLTLQ